MSEGEAHPTRGGLRIGKKLPERATNETFDERLEWDRDGQYYHYLTKWMHALDRVSRATGRVQFNIWARELAETSHDAFTYSAAGGPRRMYWKMSIDLKRPLVAAMGQHDPLDGYITAVQLHATAVELSESAGEPSLEEEIAQLGAMIEVGDWTTADPLGLGGLLTDAYRVEQLITHGALQDDDLLQRLLTASLAGLQHYAQSGELRQPAERRLAFRELGLAIGLHAVARMWEAAESNPDSSSENSALRARLQALARFAHLRYEIESFWRDPAHRAAPTWSEHRDINEVMLATSLMPEEFLVLDRLANGITVGSR